MFSRYERLNNELGVYTTVRWAGELKAGETTIRDKVPPKVSPWDINDWVVLQKALGRCHNSQEPETLLPIDLVWNSEAEADSFLELPGKLLWLSCLPTSLAAIISRVMASSLLLFISSWRTTHLTWLRPLDPWKVHWCNSLMNVYVYFPPSGTHVSYQSIQCFG